MLRRLVVVLVFIVCFENVAFSRLEIKPATLAAATSAHLENLSRHSRLNGVVLVAYQGKPIFQKAYDFANQADRVPNRLDTRFNMANGLDVKGASTGKMNGFILRVAASGYVSGKVNGFSVASAGM